jgi:hypothetical protein
VEEHFAPQGFRDLRPEIAIDPAVRRSPVPLRDVLSIRAQARNRAASATAASARSTNFSSESGISCGSTMAVEQHHRETDGLTEINGRQMSGRATRPRQAPGNLSRTLVMTESTVSLVTLVVVTAPATNEDLQLNTGGEHRKRARTLGARDHVLTRVTLLRRPAKTSENSAWQKCSHQSFEPMAQQNEVPGGYRQAITTAITVFLGFSITLLRTFWKVETIGGWTITEKLSESVIATGILLQVASLFRAINVLDNSVSRYRKTTLLFMAGVISVIFGVMLTIFVRN